MMNKINTIFGICTRDPRITKKVLALCALCLAVCSKVQKLQRAALKDPVKCAVSTKYQTVEKLLQSYIFVPAKFKDCYLVYIINELAGNSFIIFCSTCNNTQRMALLLRNLGYAAIPLHGQMNQNKRLGSLNKFKGKMRSILLATDVASRGLDIPHVDVVINFDIPTHSKDYIHRVGRTARAGRAGKSVTFVTQYDVELFQRIEQLIGKKLPEFPTREDEVMMLVERVSEAQRFALGVCPIDCFRVRWLCNDPPLNTISLLHLTTSMRIVVSWPCLVLGKMSKIEAN
uniref:RNA helicase n=1 Tax=Eptatretus burgeri TaxID=7764 RepID=A0A8C4Q1B7_EPTBU